MPRQHIEFDLHFWKKAADDSTVDLYTISTVPSPPTLRRGMGICYDLPIDQAMECLRRELEEA